MPTFEVVKASATTWSKGGIVVSNTGLAVEGADDPLIATILGVAVEDAVDGKTGALICPALPYVTFWGRIATGDTCTTADTAVTQRYVSGEGAGFDISLDATGVFVINVGDTANAPVMIINFIDAIGTAWGAVEFVFVSSAFNAVT